MSPLKRAIHSRFEEVSRAELLRLKKKTASLEPSARAAVDAVTLEVVRAMAARTTERLEESEGEPSAAILAQLFGVRETT